MSNFAVPKLTPEGQAAAENLGAVFEVFQNSVTTLVTSSVTGAIPPRIAAVIATKLQEAFLFAKAALEMRPEFQDDPTWRSIP